MGDFLKPKGGNGGIRPGSGRKPICRCGTCQSCKTRIAVGKSDTVTKLNKGERYDWDRTETDRRDY